MKLGWLTILNYTEEFLKVGRGIRTALLSGRYYISFLYASGSSFDNISTGSSTLS